MTPLFTKEPLKGIGAATIHARFVYLISEEKEGRRGTVRFLSEIGSVGKERDLLFLMFKVDGFSRT